MPILNAVHTTFDSVYLPVPTEDSPTSDVWKWGDGYRFIVSNIGIKQVSTLDFDTEVIKGDPRGTVWSVGETVWQVDVSIPFLVPEAITTDDKKSFPTTFTEPCCANFPLPETTDLPITLFLAAILKPKTGAQTAENTSGGMWPTYWENTPSDLDIIIQRLSVQITEGRSTLDLTLICTWDPRSKFKIKQVPVASTSPIRTAAPFDFVIPYGSGYLGSMVDYSGGYTSWPERGDFTGSGNHGLVRQWGFTIQSNIQRFKSVGTPSSRPLLGVSGITCEGNLKYIPIVKVEGGSGTIVVNDNETDRIPVGWTVDRQTVQSVGRSGGQLYVAGQPPYSGNKRPIYIGMGMRKGNETESYWVLHPDALGPIGVAAASFDAAAGSENTVSIDFKTLVGVTPTEFANLAIVS